MEPPKGFWASLWNFIRFLPYFIGLLLLGNIKGKFFFFGYKGVLFWFLWEIQLIEVVLAFKSGKRESFNGPFMCCSFSRLTAYE